MRCLWCSGRSGWARLAELAKRRPELDGIEIRWAEAITEKRDPALVLSLLERLADRISEKRSFSEDTAVVEAWSEAIAALLGPGGPGAGLAVLGASVASEVDQQLTRLEGRGLSAAPRIRAQICNAAGMHKQAAKWWEVSGDDQTRDYYRAKALTEPYPDQITWLHKLGSSQEIVEAYDADQKAARTELSRDQAEIVCEAMLETGMTQSLLGLSWDARLPLRAFEAAARAVSQGKMGAGESALSAYAQMIALNGDWGNVSRLIDGKPPKSAGGRGGKYKKYRAMDGRQLLKSTSRSGSRSCSIGNAVPGTLDREDSSLRLLE